MIKPPSLVREYTWIWSQDPALDAPPKDASKKARADWDRRLKLARETGVYDGLMKPGEQPTTFSLKLIANETWLTLVGLVRSGAISDVEWPMWAGRMALHAIGNTGMADEADLKRQTVADFPRLGQMAPAEAFDQFGPMGIAIANDMFVTLLERQAAPSPK